MRERKATGDRLVDCRWPKKEREEPTTSQKGKRPKERKRQTIDASVNSLLKKGSDQWRGRRPTRR